MSQRKRAAEQAGGRLRVFALDEARFGLQTHFRRRWCPNGHRPPWPHRHRYQWLWLYAAVEPLFIPARSPELDPAERWFRELRGALSNVAHATLANLEEALSEAMQEYLSDVRRLARLVGYDWWIDVTGSILTSSA